jgi:RNA polymerase sigma factor (sigma-70 family)
MLLERSRAGDDESFGEFYVRYNAVLLAYLVRRIKQPELAVDLMAESFASALIAARDTNRSLPTVPVAWLFLIAKNHAIDASRRGIVEATAREALRLEPLELEDSDIEHVLEIAAGAELRRDVAKRLTAAEWEAFQAYVFEDEPYPAIAVRLECSEAVVRKRVSRAKSRLRSDYGGSNV